MPETPRAEGADTARRALRILEIVGASSDPVMLDELIRRTGYSKSMVYRLLRVLQDESYVEHAKGGGYLGGSKLFALAASALPNFDTHTAYLPMLQQIASEAGETCTLHRRIGDQAMLILGAESTLHPLRRVLTIGELTPVTRGSSGLAILVSLADDLVDQLLANKPVDDVERVRQEIRQIRQDGFVLSFEANHPGLHGLAAPLPGTEMSVSVSGPGSRWTKQKMLDFAPRFLATLAERTAAIK